MLTAQDLHDAFMDLGARAWHEGKVIDLAIYGGSALLLASNFRVATQSASVRCGAPEIPQLRKDAMLRPHTLAEVAQRRNAGEDFSLLLRKFLDEFYSAVRRGEAAACIAGEPECLPDLQEHASLGAIGEHLARRWNLSIPPWTDDPSRFLRRPYFTTTLEGLKALLLAESPIAFRRRLIFTEAEPLRRARMPTGP